MNIIVFIIVALAGAFAFYLCRTRYAKARAEGKTVGQALKAIVTPGGGGPGEERK